MCIGQTMGRTGVDDELGSFNLCCRGFAGGVDWYHLVIITVDHQRRHIKLLQVSAEVCAENAPIES